MSNIKNILCVVDPTETTQPALGRAAWLATRTGAKLGLLICYYNEFLSGRLGLNSEILGLARDETMEHYRERLEKLAEPHRKAGLDVNVAAVWDHPLHEGIVRYACKSGVDIVLKDTHPHHGLGLTALTNTDWSLIQGCPMPLWLVKPNEIPEKPQFIAAIDPTHEHDKPAALDDEIFRLGNSIAEAVGGDIHVFHSFDTPDSGDKVGLNLQVDTYVPPADLGEQVKKFRRLRFEEFLEKHEIDGDKAHLVGGHTHEALPQLASDLDAALVVMGAIARNRLKRIFIGSTAARTLERLPCDLLIVKPGWYETPVQLEIQDTG